LYLLLSKSLKIISKIILLMTLIDEPFALLKRMKGIMYFLITKKQKVHCQACNYDLTGIGALVTEKGEAYCHNDLRCLEKGLACKGYHLPVEGDFNSPMDLQVAIKEGTLRRHYFISK
jgi:hypothetical protein